MYKINPVNPVNRVILSKVCLSRLKTSLRYYFYLGYNAPDCRAPVSPAKVIIRERFTDTNICSNAILKKREG
jgi:hypothetical protein